MEDRRLTTLLRQHGPNAGGRGIDFNNKRYLGIRMTKDGGCAESFFKLVEGFVGKAVPGQGLGFTS